jgi:carboxypeptidase Taq
MSAYSELEAKQRDLSRFRELSAIAGWDEACMMPPGGGAGRAEALAALGGLIHERSAAPEIGELLTQARNERLDAWQDANVDEIDRQWRTATAVPAELVKAHSLATSHCEQAWREARGRNDWRGIQPLLEEVVRLSRERASALADAMDLDPYDALLETYEPELRSHHVEKEFDNLKGFLPSLLDRVLGAQSTPLPLEGPFAVADQRALCEATMRTLGFDFNRGRFDVSHHPFCGGVPDDTRITTRYDETGFLESLMAICHETGHALYQQGLPVDWRDQPVGDALGAAVHESQSLLLELQVCRSRAFIEHIAPAIRQAFSRASDDAAWSAENLYQHAIRVERGLIRVQADEVTYPLHVILRFELERDMIAGRLAVADLPDAWNDAMQRYLGRNTDGDYANGCMQDVHWFAGLFGYFPTYTLGAMTAAQWFATAREADADILPGIQRGDLAPLLRWLRQHIHGQGRKLVMQPLLREVTGSELDAGYFQRHLSERYLA